jgi:regulatory protein
VPRISSIERQKKNRSRFSIFIDGDYSFSCNGAELAALNLSHGDDLSAGQLEDIQQQLDESRARNYALSLLSRRSRSCREIEDGLKRKGYSKELRGEIIDWLLERRYLNDAQFAEQWVDARLRTAPRGRHKLMAELLEKGVDRSTAQDAVDEHLPAENEPEVAYRLLRQRSSRWQGEERLEMRRKVLNFLRYRGFSGAAAYDAGNRFLEEMLESSGD